MSHLFEVIPDNREVLIADADSEVTINMFNSDGYTSANDTATNKYFDVSKTRTRYSITADQAFQILAYNGTALTNARNVAANAVFQESEVPALTSIKIKSLVANTTIKLFVR